MSSNLRGLQTLRQLCHKHKQLAVDTSTASEGRLPLSCVYRLTRSLSAQPATELRSEDAQLDAERAVRQAELPVHESLVRALHSMHQQARSEASAGGEAYNARRVMQEFAPIRLVGSPEQYANSADYQRVAALWHEQLELEISAARKLQAEYAEQARQLKRVGGGGNLSVSRSLMQQWYPALKRAIDGELAAIYNNDAGKDRFAYGPFLSLLGSEKLAVLTLHGVLGTLMAEDEAGKVKLTRIAMAVGKAVNEQVGIESLKGDLDVRDKWQKKISGLQRRMWNDFAEVQAAGGDWEPIRQEYDAQIQELLGNRLQTDETWHDAALAEAKARRRTRRRKSPRREATGAVPRDYDWEEEAFVPRAAPMTDEMKQDLQAHLQARSLQLEDSELLAQAATCPPTVKDPQEPIFGKKQPADPVTSAKDAWFALDPRYQAQSTALRARYRKMAHGYESLTARSRFDMIKGESWRSRTAAKVGTALTQLLIESATVKVEERDQFGNPTGRQLQEPALQHKLMNTYDEKGKGWWKKFGMVIMHDEVLRQLSDKEIAGIHLPVWMPMVIPPRDWTSPRNGGYLSHQPPIMRLRGGKSQYEHLWAKHDDGSMFQIYDALNAMGKTAWTINSKLLENVLYAYKELKGGFCGLPLYADPETDNTPRFLDLQPRFMTKVANGQLTASVMEAPKSEQMAHKGNSSKVLKKWREMRSLRCDLAYKLKVAEDYDGKKAFYYPHNLDFRGRAYPMHPNLNHLGADLNRGLLQFADAKPLGADGLRWLEISVANLYGSGADKLSFDGRVQFARDHLDDIFDSAENPFGGSRWWQQADSPWQLLAVCCDLQAALASGDPERYYSRLPVHQDGSCNGLQHYAALGRDRKGGQAVNLLPVDKPQDVYTEIARLVKAQVEKDAAAGLPEAQVLIDNVDRKLVKQTVMTSVYGVTFVGARQQISSRLTERGWDDERLTYKTGTYGAKVTLSSLHKMFDSAKDIMQWLSNCAKVVARSDTAVKWTTPLGLPVVQPYRQKTKSHVQTLLQRVILVHSDENSPIMKARQRSAFPPNYIHCLDSSHMMLTAIDCAKAGLSFAGVHDSFWTHAGSVDTMNKILREKFYELHSQPLLDNLRSELVEYYPGDPSDIPPVPQLGTLDLQKITEAEYFFN